ncbi:MAG TPA: Holliday junction branch migration protein RuvA [Anaerolineales bacterium]|nr:Holliday junction branch migration protein RuvA [Anaerolineales bacterium]
MIASLAGEVIDINPDHVVIAVGGVGLQVYLPAPLKDRLRAGERVFLHTYLVVREDALTLYGFETKEGRQLFSMLLGVNGVGPRLGLAILSTLNPDAIRRAVFHEQDEIFSRVPGVGKRTAQKILIHLQDRLPLEAGLQPMAIASETDSDLLAALTSLGYSVVEAQAAIQAIPRDAPQDEETRLRIALQYFIKP